MKDSEHSSDDLSSGVFSSCNSWTETNLEWLASLNQPCSYCFEGEMTGSYITMLYALWPLFLLLFIALMLRCWHLDRERAGRVSEDSRTPACQSRPCCYRNKSSGKRWFVTRLKTDFSVSWKQKSEHDADFCWVFPEKGSKVPAQVFFSLLKFRNIYLQNKVEWSGNTQINYLSIIHS